jgi:cytosine/adenosine deaminase-related metal-dependent hydrolase
MFETNGLVCAHHHLYSALARGMPAPPKTPESFIEVLEQIWWRLDAALDLDMLYWSAALGAAEAVLSGTTAIIDHHESPNAIEGSLSALAAGASLVGVRTNLCYGVTDRWDHNSMSSSVVPSRAMTEAAQRGLQENERFIAEGGRGMIGVHAAFTCSNDLLEQASDLATRLGVGVHIHVAEGPDDAHAFERLRNIAKDDWLLIHCVNLQDELPGTIVHNPRSNMNNAVGYAAPRRFKNRVVLGTDGIGADMMEEARLAYVKMRETDLTATPDIAWEWLANGEQLFPEVANDMVIWNYDHIDSPWHSAFTTGLRPREVYIDGTLVVDNGRPVTFDMDEIRAKSTEAAMRLHNKLT